MPFLRSAALALALLLPPTLLTAQECTIRVVMQQGATSSNLMPPETFTLSRGEVRSITRNYVRELHNDGDHDLTVELRVGNAGSVHRLVAVDGQTAFLPAVALVGQQLVGVTCEDYATWGDAQTYLEELGTSATTLVSQSRSEAEAAIEGAQAEARALYDSLGVAAWLNELDDASSETEARWNALLADVAPETTARQIGLERDFPELAAALDATFAYPAGIDDEIDAARMRWTRFGNELNAFEQELRASAGTLVDFVPDLSTDFPEIVQASAVSCSIEEQPVLEVGVRAEALATALTELDRELGFSSAVARAMAFPQTLMDEMADLEPSEWCARDFEGVEAARQADRMAMRRWRLRRRAAMDRLPTRVQRQVARDHDRVEAARARVDAAEERIERGRPEWAQVREDRREAWEVLRDRNASTEDRIMARRTLRRTQSAERERYSAYRELGQARAAESRAEERLAGSIDAMRNPPQALRDYLAVLRARPRPTVTLEYIEDLGDCIGTVDTILTEVEDALESAGPELSDDVRAALQAMKAASDALISTPLVRRPPREVRRAHRTAERDRPRVDERRGVRITIGRRTIVLPSVSASDPIGTLEAASSDLREGLRRFVGNVRRLTRAVATRRPDLEGAAVHVDALASATSDLSAALERERGRRKARIDDVVAAAQGAVQARVSAEGTMAEWASCAAKWESAATSLESRLDTRLTAFEARLLDALTPEIPADVEQAIDRLGPAITRATDDLEAAHAAHAKLFSETGELISALLGVAESVDYPDVNRVPAPPLPGGAPVGFPNLGATPAAIRNAIDEAEELDASREAFLAATREAANSQTMVQTRATELADAIAAEARLPGASLSDPPSIVEQQVLDEEHARFEELVELWAAAALATPGRLIAIAPVAAANLVQEQRRAIQSEFAALASDLAAFQQCAVTASQAYRHLATGPSANVDFALNMARAVVQGIDDEASNVLGALDDFLTPTTSGLPDPDATFAAAEALLQLVKSVSERAEERYEDETSAQRAVLQQANSCQHRYSPVRQGVDRLVEELDALEASIEFWTDVIPAEFGG